MRGDDYVIKDVNNLTGIDKLHIIGAGHERRGQTDAANALYDIADQIAREHAEDCFKMGYLAAERIEELEREVKHQQDVGTVHLERIGELVDENKGLRKRVENQRASLDGLTAAIGELRPRLMPEGMEWMLWDDGKPVAYDDAPDDVVGVYLALDGSGYALMTDMPDQLMSEPGERVKRPAPKVLDADGVEIRVGDTVWHVETGEQCKVVEVDSRSVSVDLRADGDGTKHTGSVLPVNLTHRAPVLAADGKPLREGETVYLTDSPTAFVVDDIMTREDGAPVVHLVDGAWNRPQDLTHERPDSWERLEKDSKMDPGEYCETYGLRDAHMGREAEECAKASDLVRRSKKLAERDV